MKGDRLGLRYDPPWQFPSPKGGGPIEGSPNALNTLNELAGFHRRKAVAPLKVQLDLLCFQLSLLVSIAERRWPH